MVDKLGDSPGVFSGHMAVSKPDTLYNRQR